jgi:hypothetical protein
MTGASSSPRPRSKRQVSKKTLATNPRVAGNDSDADAKTDPVYPLRDGDTGVDLPNPAIGNPLISARRPPDVHAAFRSGSIDLRGRLGELAVLAIIPCGILWLGRGHLNSTYLAWLIVFVEFIVFAAMLMHEVSDHIRARRS